MKLGGDEGWVILRMVQSKVVYRPFLFSSFSFPVSLSRRTKDAGPVDWSKITVREKVTGLRGSEGISDNDVVTVLMNDLSELLN